MPYKFSGPLSTRFALLIPTYTDKHGVMTPAYPDASDVPEALHFNGTIRTFGGSERTVNNLFVVEDTGTVETWYRPDIKADCHVAILPEGDEYEILATPEDIDRRHQFMVFRVRRVAGGA